MKATEYNQCVKEYADRLYRFAVSRLSDTMDAEDVVQLVFERLWKRHEEVEIEAVKTYLFTSVHRACIDLFRKRKVQREAAAELQGDEPVIMRDDLENRQLIETLLEKLNETQKTLILLRDYEGYPYKEIAEITGLTESQVKINLFRARKKLQFFLTSRHPKAIAI